MVQQSINPEDFFILVVDDVALNLKVLRAILEPIGYEVSFATGGKQALARIASAKPDIILLDLMMPEMDGLEVCQVIKNDSALAEIPIIFLSASQEKEHLLQAFEMGAVDYVTKPFNKLELLARINTHLTLKHYQDCLQKQTEQERLRNKIIYSIRRSLNLDYILKTAVSEICYFLKVDKVTIFKLTDSYQGKILAESTSTICQIAVAENTYDLSWMEQSFHFLASSRIHVIDNINDSSLSPLHLDFLIAGNVKAELIVPIYQQDYLWGTLIAHHCQNSHTWSTDEIKLLSEIAAELEVAIQQSQLYQKLDTAYQELQYLAHTDSLTQLANRRQFDQYITQEWWRLKREQKYLSLIMCDIDYFKPYNDCYGHPSGDVCLQKVAKILSEGIKRPADLVARYGGEEFAVILPDTNLEGAINVAQQIQQAITSFKIPHIQSPIEQYITLSMGVTSVIPNDNITSDDLITAADKALYTAKSNGRNQYFHSVL
ncbi:diguanylate cyclase domain-containing protein [Anabaena sp. UHCC 0204]|uniref:diguanylate cyclase domain-containing protein n=1 Tax=Anabaena sp. UHCC 0204 TaxID=2590009 RepID=UPI0014476216|nr:diguanylate cyclase [Anabaena sp. UHCC 0204]MTJ09836.1 diguanylate cyclase [Anabaena sp. UHCC 0204]